MTEIRIPASECGLVGLKPTRARVSRGPDVGEGWGGATIDGVVSRTVRAVAAAGRLLESLGCDVSFASPGAAVRGGVQLAVHRDHRRRHGSDAAGAAEVLGRPIADEELEPRNAFYRLVGDDVPAKDYLAARQWLGIWVRRTSLWWTAPDQGGAGFDPLVTATVASPPPELGWMTGEQEGQRISSFMPYTAQFTVTGQPAVSRPLHWTASGLPVGVQLVAEFGREDVLVRVAAALEEAAPWKHRRPSVRAWRVTPRPGAAADRGSEGGPRSPRASRPTS